MNRKVPVFHKHQKTQKKESWHDTNSSSSSIDLLKKDKGVEKVAHQHVWGVCREGGGSKKKKLRQSGEGEDEL